MRSVIETRRNHERMESCPRFETCDAQKCPLDERIDFRVKLPGEPECDLRKDVRLRLGHDMEKRGLFSAEIAAIERFHGSVDAYIEHKRGKRPTGVAT